MDLSVIVVNWNTCELLAQCLRSVYDTAGDLDLEVIVVDNASKDGSVEMVQKMLPQVRLIQNTENVGFARANNQGIRVSQGRYILLLNSDVLVLQGTLNRIVDFIAKRPRVGALSCQLLNEDGSVQSFPTRRVTLVREFCRVFYIDKLLACLGPQPGQSNNGGAVERIKGACMLLRRETIDSVGLMEENFFMFAEEDDWCLRILKDGWKIYFLPEVAVIHYGGRSVEQASEEMFLHLHRSKIAFFCKHYGRRTALALKAIYLTGYAVRIGGAVVASLICPYFRQNLRNYWQLVINLPTL